jgi:hypothetical protein
VGVSSCIEQGIAVAERIHKKYQLSSFPSAGGTA